MCVYSATSLVESGRNSYPLATPQRCSHNQMHSTRFRSHSQLATRAHFLNWPEACASLSSAVYEKEGAGERKIFMSVISGAQVSERVRESNDRQVLLSVDLVL